MVLGGGGVRKEVYSFAIGTSSKLALQFAHSSELISAAFLRSSHDDAEIMMKKCGKYFIGKYTLPLQTISYVNARDIDGTNFNINTDKEATFSSGTNYYKFKPVDICNLIVEYADRFNMYFELLNNHLIGMTNFTISVHAPGFIT